MKQNDKCPLCAQAKFNEILQCTDYTVSKKIFTIVDCTNCGFRFTNPIPDENDLGKYYESEDYISHSNTSKGMINQIYQLVRGYTLRIKVKLLKKISGGNRLLDIGCGTGEFLNQCKKANFDVLGVEPSKEARDFGIKKYGLNIKEESALQNIKAHSLDIISMWHVLEHVYHLNNRIEEMARTLKKDGVVLVAVPNYTSHDAAYYKEYWAAYDVPRHLYHFSPKSIEDLFDKHGFRLTEIKPMPFDSYYVSMLSEKYKNGHNNIFKSFWRGFKSNLKAAQSKEHKYSSQIYIFKKSTI